MQERTPVANLITKAIEIAGLLPIAKECGVTYQAVRKWEEQGRMPRTEWTGETNHSEKIELITDGKVSRAQLLKWGVSTAA